MMYALVMMVTIGLESSKPDTIIIRTGIPDLAVCECVAADSTRRNQIAICVKAERIESLFALFDRKDEEK